MTPVEKAREDALDEAVARLCVLRASGKARSEISPTKIVTMCIKAIEELKRSELRRGLREDG